MNIIFLHARLSGYFLACIKNLIKTIQGNIFIYHYPLNEDAPFSNIEMERVSFHHRTTIAFPQMLKEISDLVPQIIFCSGWFDKDYVKICRHFSGKIPTILCMDNQWHGTLKQYFACVGSRLGALKCFSGVWVPGEPQKQYALHLGFKPDKIRTGYYSADVPLFEESYQKFTGRYNAQFPKRFVFVGRYVAIKGVLELWKVFVQLQKDGYAKDWELWCFGKGELFEKRVVHPNIKHFGFVQPSAMIDYISEGGVFILPSHFEPWGVVVHEFAVAGFPMICSISVGAATQFVQNSINGYLFDLKDVDFLYKTMKIITQKIDKDLFEMSRKSHQLGLTITPNKWVKTVMDLIDKD